MRKLAFALFFILLGLPTVTEAGAITRPPTNQSLVGYWSFNEGEGSYATDFSGSGNHGQLKNSLDSTGWVEGQRDTGLNFDGTDDYIMTNDSASLDFADGEPITLAMWIKPESFPGFREFFVKGRNDVNTNANYALRLTDARKLEFYYRSVDTQTWQIWTTTSAHLSTSTWSHVAVTYTYGTGSSIKMYVDGAQVSGSWTSNTGDEAPVQNDEGIVFASKQFDNSGSGDPDTYFDGALDEVRLYKRILSQVEISSLIDYTVEQRAKVASNTGLVGYWSFEDGAGTKAGDFSGNGKTGTLQGSMTDADWVSGKRGTALDLDGGNDHVTLPALGILSANQITISAWVKSDVLTGSHRAIVTDAYDSQRVKFRLSLGGDSASGFLNAGFYTGSWQEAVDSTEIETNTWYHVMGVFDGTTIRLYKNGTQVATDVPGVGLPTVGNDTWIIGKRHDTSGTNDHWNGQIDDVRIYNRAVSAEEAAAIYNQGAATRLNTTHTPENLKSGLVGHWTFDGQDVVGTTAYDKSRQGNNGTLAGNPTPILGRIGQALRFPNNGTVTLSDFAFGGTSPISICAWINLDNFSGWDGTGAQRIVSQGDEVVLRTNGSDIEFILNSFTSNDRVSPASGISLQTWHHVCGTYVSGGDITAYVDGVAKESVTPSGSYLDSSAVFKMSEGSDEDLQGAIDDVRIYNRALSADEVRQLYNLGN